MGQSEFDKRMEEAADALSAGIGWFLTGRDLDGIRRTDATFLRPGRRVLPKVEGAVHRSSYRAGWQRLVFRISGLSVTAGTGYAYWEEPQSTLASLEYGGVLAAGAASLAGIAHTLLTREQRELMREWVTPLHHALAVPLGIPEQTDPRRYLHVPVNYTDDDARIRIDLPLHLRFSQDLVADVIAKKLALENVSFTWHYAGKDPYLVVKKAHRPPNVLRLSDPGVREMLASMPESAPLIGCGAGNRKVSVDLDDDSPHVLVSAGTGGGKSTILRTITCQFIRNGAHAFVLDFKRISHVWARGVPGMTYCRDIADIHDALLALGQEGRRRIRLAEALGDDVLAEEPEKVGPRLVILLEEVNATMKQLARYWDRIRESGDPKTSPAIDALAEILFMGRQVRLHVLLVAQSATARALGGPEMREQFATRILSRYTLNAWRMLVPEVHPAPKPTRHTGRVQVVMGGVAHETQVLYLTDAEARAWAMSGTSSIQESAREAEPAGAVVDFTKAMPQAADPDVGPDSGPASPAGDHDDAEHGTEVLVGLRQAHQQHLPDITLATLRWARANDPDFPSAADRRGPEFVYRVGDLLRWARNRPRGSGTPAEA
ncbi:helicase HerA domain-containing protein [Streptomyces sp. TRM68367]|uniref:helicase HerA domain-containing protein n=1 Tax=Streptomyces sp. TRM68367 TaxID=2758415 RepID=UPI00165BF18B|nr:DUF87 domain-containing protein [Streptomyces sp. TRM68367]MBC9729305.1 DUF87 domain-containing protein [Streptomyces sp. TRM68367]